MIFNRSFGFTILILLCSLLCINTAYVIGSIGVNGYNPFFYNLHTSIDLTITKPSNGSSRIIILTKADKLDIYRNYAGDITPEVDTRDGIWSERIENGEYVRIRFEMNLTNKNDITIYARGIRNESASIEVFAEHGNVSIAKFDNIGPEGWYKIYLTNLTDNKSIDVFDLKISGGAEFDYIVDPTLAIGNITTLCGDITAYDTIYINGSGVLNICPFNTTIGTGYVNFTLGKYGNFTMDAGGFVNGTGRGSFGGAGTIASGGGSAAIQGTNGTGNAGFSSTSANGGGGGGGQRNGAATASGGGGGGFGGAGGIGADGQNANSIPGSGGNIYGSSTSTRLYTGSGGGGGAGDVAFTGGSGGAGISVDAGSGVINIAGTINVSGNPGNGTTGIASVDIGGSGGGSGGHIILRALTIIINGTLSVSGGHGGDTDTVAAADHCGGGGGGGGRILIIYRSLINSSMKSYFSGGAAGISSPLASNCVALPAAGVAGSQYTNQTNTSWPDLIYPIFSNFSDNNGTLIFSGMGIFNVTVLNSNGTVLLEINNTNITATNLSGNIYTASYNFTRNGTYPYRWISWGNGSQQNYNVSLTNYYTVISPALYPPTVNLISPANNTPVIYSNITFFYNVTDVNDNVSRCSFIIDGVFVLNTTVIPVPKNTTLNFTYNITNGQHNWSVWCNDTFNFNSTSEVRNITADLRPLINWMFINDSLPPEGEIILLAGSTRRVVCTVNASDYLGSSNIANATANFYYFLNKSGDSDDNTVHYSNTNCSINSTTVNEKIFDCAFNVYYYANNGTWQCNATVFNKQAISRSSNITTLIQSLYAINISDGIYFGAVAPNTESINVTANITNFGNVPINITVQGYSITPGDSVGMNCSDGTNISIGNIKFSTKQTDSFIQKTSLNGSIQYIGLTMGKQVSQSTPILNASYWQVMPDPGVSNKVCEGRIIFSGEAS